MWRHPLRVLLRLIGCGLLAWSAVADYLWHVWLPDRGRDYRARAAWMQRQAQKLLRLLNLNVAFVGETPARGMLVCNHLSYLDIVVLGAAQPMVFVAKSEVSRWPLIGFLTRCAGTLFIDRRRKSAVMELSRAMEPVAHQGVPLALFPEGTSSDGAAVLPFHPPLLQPAVTNHWPVSPAWIGYRLEDGSVADEVCYWRDMTLLPHFLNLLSKAAIQATVAYGPPIQPGADRKQLAHLLQAEVSRLAPSARIHGSAAIVLQPHRNTAAKRVGTGVVGTRSIRVPDFS